MSTHESTHGSEVSTYGLPGVDTCMQNKKIVFCRDFVSGLVSTQVSIHESTPGLMSRLIAENREFKSDFYEIVSHFNLKLFQIDKI